MKTLLFVSNKISRYLLIALGWICIALGIIGIFLPLLPTTVFILIAAWCFVRSSDRFHQWLLNQPTLGPIVTQWRNNSGIPLRARNRAILFMWLTMFSSMVIVAKVPVVILLTVIGALVSMYLLQLKVIEDLTPEEVTPQ